MLTIAIVIKPTFKVLIVVSAAPKKQNPAILTTPDHEQNNALRAFDRAKQLLRQTLVSSSWYRLSRN
jgi:hypothetical protein